MWHLIFSSASSKACTEWLFIKSWSGTSKHLVSTKAEYPVLLSCSSKKNVSNSTKTSTCSSSISPRHSTLNRAALWAILSKLGCPPRFVQIIRSFHDGMFCRVIENGDASDPFPVSNAVKQGCVLVPTLFSLLFAQMLSAALSQTEAGVKIHYRTDGDFFNLRRLKSYTKVTRAIVRDFLFADDCALAAHSEVDLQELADCFATAAKSFRLTVSIKKTEVLRQLAPKHCSALTQHHHWWKCAEKCRHLQIPRQLHKLCSQPWWWGSVPHLMSKPGIWAPPHPSMARAGHLDQDQAECIPSCCATVSIVRLRDLDSLQAAYQETGPVPPALPSQSSPCQLEGTCAKPGYASLGWAHWHWSHVEPGTASLVRDMSRAWTTADSQNTCSMLSSQLVNATKEGRGSGAKTCWNWRSRPATSQLTSGKPWPRTGRPGGQLHARAQSTLREADYRAWMIRDCIGKEEQSAKP